MDYPLTMLVVVSTCVVSILAWQRPQLIEALMLDTRAMLDGGQGYRLLTSGWVHADMTHLLFNMFSLWSFGSTIERVYGPAAMIGPYLAGILGGSLIAALMHRREEYRALGASGGVCGAIFASVLLLPGGSVMMFFIPFPIPASLYAFGFLLFTYWGMRRGVGRIGHDAHFGGAIVGILTAAALYPRAALHQMPLLLAILAVSGVLFALSYRAQAKRSRHGRWD